MSQKALKWKWIKDRGNSLMISGFFLLAKSVFESLNLYLSSILHFNFIKGDYMT